MTQAILTGSCLLPPRAMVSRLIPVLFLPKLWFLADIDCRDEPIAILVLCGPLEGSPIDWRPIEGRLLRPLDETGPRVRRILRQRDIKQKQALILIQSSWGKVGSTLTDGDKKTTSKHFVFSSRRAGDTTDAERALYFDHVRRGSS